MESVAHLSQILSQVLETEANRLARETGWQERKRKLSGADFVQTLIDLLVARTGDQPGWVDASGGASRGGDQ